jgi:aryl carrier-like protein
MPLNVNGKVDKARLPIGRPSSRQGRAVSSDGMEDAIRQIASDLTGQALAAAPADESLLDLGLDSLQMMMLLAYSAKRFLPETMHELMFSDLEKFVREPTLESLARHLRKLASGVEAHGQ